MELEQFDALIPDLEAFKFNGVIHVGGDYGASAQRYHGIGIHKVMWIEKDSKKYTSLYEETKRFGMKQVTHLTDLNETKFKQLWRDNAAYMDVDTYDLLHFTEENSNLVPILEGFEDFLQGFRAVLINANSDNDEHATWLSENTNFHLVSRCGNLQLFM